MSGWLIVAGAGVWIYAYAGYPFLLALSARTRRRRPVPVRPPADLPQLSISLPVFNGAATIGAALDALLACDYPADRRQVVVVSDGSTDATDEIVRGYAGRGVELVRVPVRGGKTAAEAFAASWLTGEIVVNTDAAVRVHPAALRALVAEFEDPSVGVASGRDVSVAAEARVVAGESAYVGYEMWVRQLETRVDGIVGSSGSLYAIRAALHRHSLAPNLSRDFASAMIARQAGYRAVSVPGAVCFVPRGASLRKEYHRKVRTMARGLATLFAFRQLLTPRHHPWFTWMLWSHKVARWLTPAGAAAVVLGVGLMAGRSWWGGVGSVSVAVVVLLGVAGWMWPAGRPTPRILAAPAYFVVTTVAGVMAWYRALGGGASATWEPTRRAAADLR